MAERLNLSVDDGVGDILSALAGSERRRGQYLSDLIRGMAATSGQPGLDNAMLQAAVQGLAGQLRTVDARLIATETQLSALIAKTADRQ